MEITDRMVDAAARRYAYHTGVFWSHLNDKSKRQLAEVARDILEAAAAVAEREAAE